MPMYDFDCPDCGQSFERLAKFEETIRCERCGAVTMRRFPSPNVIDDSVPGGFVIENMGHKPMKFYSKSEYKREMELRGLVPYVKHVGSKGSDKNPNTTRWT